MLKALTAGRIRKRHRTDKQGGKDSIGAEVEIGIETILLASLLQLIAWELLGTHLRKAQTPIHRPWSIAEAFLLYQRHSCGCSKYIYWQGDMTWI